MTKIAVCDDEPKIAEDISAFVSGRYPDSQVLVYTSGAELLGALCDDIPGILLLDIDMPGISGLDIAQRLSGLPEKPLLVFVTGHDELVYDSLQFHPFGFVRKSYLYKELSAVLADAFEELGGKDRHFRFHSTVGDVKLMLDEILYFESDGNYIKLFTPDREYRFRNTISSIENTLSDSGFIRIHKGFLVNQSAVKMINSEECVLSDNIRLPIGRSYSENARKQLMRYMLK